MPDQARYASLDAVRGVAALSVTAFHCVNSHPQVHNSQLGRALLYGWFGVFIFFPVSGYCICAALDRAENGAVGRFLRRRWMRIYPPYWASVIVAVAIALLALPFNRGTLTDLLLPAWMWAAVATLTQVFTPHPHMINPVYWSLCYEEQFYLVMALALLGSPQRRPLLLAVVTGVAALYPHVPSLQIRGLFLEYWLAFAPGCSVYIWLHQRHQRASALLIAAMAVVSAASDRNQELGVSLVTAALMLAAARFDAAIARARLVAPLMAIGAISFSLYLIHVPVGGRVTNLLVRFNAPLWLAGVCAIAASIAAALILYALVERPAWRRRTGGADMPAPVLARAR